MSSCIKSISQILNETDSLINLLENPDIYYAHIFPGSSKEAETLREHIDLVLKKFDLLSKTHNLNNILDLLIEGLFYENKLEINYLISNYIKLVWVNAIVFHDYGKVNENFQASPDKMKNPNFKGKETDNSPLSTHHSSLGAYLFIAKHLEDMNSLDEKYDNLVSSFILSISYSIFKHHGKYLDDCFQKRVRFNSLEATFMSKYLRIYKFNISDDTKESLKSIELDLYNNHNFNKYLNSFSLYSLVRLNFSLLTASDFLASSQYMTGLEVTDFGVLSRQRIDEIYEFVGENDWLNEAEGKRNFNRSTFEKSKTNYSFLNPIEQNNTNLNLLRQEMGIEVLQTIRKNWNKNLFYIEAPTGGGKTNLSFLATVELLKLNESLNKVFYVFPFTTLVSQTQKSLVETLGLSINEVITLSSKSGFKERKEQESYLNKEDDYYGNQKKFYLDNLFCFFPFCLLTHIKFFNILKTNEKEENYLLHRLANSVVVIDELQAYSPTEWDKIIYFIKNYAWFYNIRFIVMSATLPKLGDLKILKKYSQSFIYLIDDAKKRYFQNPNFAKRVSFDLEYFDKKDLTLDFLADLVLSKSHEYSKKDLGDAKPADSVYTIVEFIFKKSTTQFYNIIKEKEDFFDEIFVLSGTILEHRRRYIINFLKNSENRKKRILLITTQVVEAGVDIDMDLGFKDKSLIDSDEQLAGRINRNVNKKDCVLYLFNYNNEKVIYGRDKRYENTKSISKSDYLEILRTKEFDKIYNKILEGIDKWNETESAVGFDEYEDNIKKLKFQSTHFDFQLIENDQENLSVFIPMEIPIRVPGIQRGDWDDVFSENELAFLKMNNISPNDDGMVEGKKVFDLYLKLTGTKSDITTKMAENKIMQGVLSKFIIQMLAGEKVKTVLFQDVDKSDKGYIYMEGWEQVYSEEFGLDHTAFDLTDTQFL